VYPGAYHVNCTGSSANHSTTSSGTIGSSTMSSSTGNGNRVRFYGRPQGGFGTMIAVAKTSLVAIGPQ